MQLARRIFLILFFPSAAFAQTTFSCPANQYVATQSVNTGQGCAALPASVTNVSGATSGGFAVSTTSPTSTPVISVAPDGTHYLPTAADQSNWNGKQAAGSYITGLTGDVTATGAGSAAATLATVNANVGTFGSTTTVPVVTFDAKGRATSVTTATIAAGGTAFQANGTALAASSPVNYRNGLGNRGVLVTNPSAGIVDFNLSLPIGGAGPAFTTGPTSAGSQRIAVFNTDGSIRDNGAYISRESAYSGIQYRWVH